MGHWEALAADKRLGLESKLEAAAVEKRGKAYQPPEELKDLPKGEELPPSFITIHDDVHKPVHFRGVFFVFRFRSRHTAVVSMSHSLDVCSVPGRMEACFESMPHAFLKPESACILRLVIWHPAGSQLETRAIALLKKLQSSAHQAPLSFGGRSKARRSSAGRSRGEPQYSLNDAPLPMRKRQV